MLKRLISQTILVTLGACALASLLLAAPPASTLILNELRVETFTQPRRFSELFPRESSSPRIKGLLKACIRFPKGSVGMTFGTFGRLNIAERRGGGDAGHLAIEAIVRLTGQPIRFERTAPDGVRYLIVFADEAPNFNARQVESFNDMAVLDLREAAR